MTDTKDIFDEARTNSVWLARPVPDELLRRVYEVAKMGPTSANCCPMRVVFVNSPAAKERLRPCLNEGNVEKTMKAPATAIVAYDTLFYDLLPRLYPARDMRTAFANSAELAEATAFRNGSLQGAYLIVAARALGLDCGPMSGFDNAGVDKEFFAGTDVKSNFLCNVGYGDPAALRPRGPRFAFDEMAQII
jgi:3-hydroxypropanoate dehydrogenase